MPLRFLFSSPPCFPFLDHVHCLQLSPSLSSLCSHPIPILLTLQTWDLGTRLANGGWRAGAGVGNVPDIGTSTNIIPNMYTGGLGLSSVILLFQTQVSCTICISLPYLSSGLAAIPSHLSSPMPCLPFTVHKTLLQSLSH